MRPLEDQLCMCHIKHLLSTLAKPSKEILATHTSNCPFNKKKQKQCCHLLTLCVLELYSTV